MWHLHTVETIGLLTHLTVEVGMQVVIVVVAVTMAELIAYAVVAAFDGMYEMVLTEERRKIFDLSMVWILRSSSANDWGSIELAKASATTMRLAVGLMSCSSSNWM